MIMTRQEEIRSAGQRICWPSESTIAFKKGAEWADEHPNLERIWHNVSEEPELNRWFLAQISDNAFDTFVMAMEKNQDWENWSNGINIKTWAYINDLLPKGGLK